MSNEEIALAWERARRMAERIWEAYILGTGVEQARKDQKSLAVWIQSAQENGIVYNGCFDEVLALKV